MLPDNLPIPIDVQVISQDTGDSSKVVTITMKYTDHVITVNFTEEQFKSMSLVLNLQDLGADLRKWRQNSKSADEQKPIDELIRKIVTNQPLVSPQELIIKSANYGGGAPYEIRKAGELPIPEDDVVIFIADEHVPLAVQENITNAAGELMEQLGYELEQKEEPIFGSFWQRLGFVVKQNTTQQAIDTAVAKALAAAETRALGLPEAQRTNELSQAAAKLVDSLKDVDTAVTKVGSLLVLKKNVDGISQVFVYELPFHIKQLFDEKPGLLKNVDTVYQIMSGDIQESKPVSDDDQSEFVLPG